MDERVAGKLFDQQTPYFKEMSASLRHAGQNTECATSYDGVGTISTDSANQVSLTMLEWAFPAQVQETTLDT